MIRDATTPVAPLLALLAAALAATAGCASANGNAESIELGATDARQVAEILGPSAERTEDGGYRATYDEGWGGRLGFAYVALGSGDTVAWFVEFVGTDDALAAGRRKAIKVVYEGPIGEAILDGLRLPEESSESQFRAMMVEFTDRVVRVAMPDGWAAADSRPREQLIGLYQMVLADVRGRGSLRRQRYEAVVEAGSTRLHLASIGGGNYRLEVTGSVILGF